MEIFLIPGLIEKWKAGNNMTLNGNLRYSRSHCYDTGNRSDNKQDLILFKVFYIISQRKHV